MREVMPLVLDGAAVQKTNDWRIGTYRVTAPTCSDLFIISSKGMGWEHVSVSTRKRIPNWLEMSFVKDLFFSEDEVVMQLHPAKKNYINAHPYVLHLWKPELAEIPLPPKWMVGPYEGWEKDFLEYENQYNELFRRAGGR